MTRIKFYRVESLPEVGEVGSLYFVYGSEGVQSMLYLCVGTNSYELYTPDLFSVAKEETTQDILSAVNGIATSMYKGVPIVSQTTNATIAPNVWNVWGEVTTLTITKGNDIDGVVNNYMVRFTALEGAAITFSGFSLSWYGGEAPTWTAGNTYEISIVDNIALWAEIEPAAV